MSKWQEVWGVRSCILAHSVLSVFVVVSWHDRLDSTQGLQMSAVRRDGFHRKWHTPLTPRPLCASGKARPGGTEVTREALVPPHVSAYERSICSFLSLNTCWCSVLQALFTCFWLLVLTGFLYLCQNCPRAFIWIQIQGNMTDHDKVVSKAFKESTYFSELICIVGTTSTYLVLINRCIFANTENNSKLKNRNEHSQENDEG